jgi:hypothetical protein
MSMLQKQILLIILSAVLIVVFVGALVLGVH